MYNSYGRNTNFIGADWQEILGVGADSSLIKGSGPFQQALARKLAKRAPIVQRVAPEKKRRWTVGFGPTTIAVNTTIRLTVQPQVLFRGEKLIYTATNGGATPDTGVFITGMFVGQKDQLPNLNPIQVQAFGPGILDNEMLMDTCQPAQFITLILTNIGPAGSADPTVSFSLIGHTVL